ncbi:DUF3043 domain-containing protein [Streptomyces sp. TP-A0874]|uniref:DUF3043 domain-containing protein n=1 Tax=Streptomyces sp. TP-A0874 TaxID=549819 RepID=UPI000853613A|nr:DUF3043 domain-containing protein [Streptomyces sp. TP-A0874]
MFRSRSKDEQAAESTATAGQPKQPRDPQAPKGRPTPKRAVAQSQRRAAALTPVSRKEAAKRQREARRAELGKQREGLAKGDERFFPARDRGPVRKFVRDYVDSRFSVPEFFLPLAVIILVLSTMPSPTLQNISQLLWLCVIVVMILDFVTLSFRLKKRLRERFPDENLRGAVPYALMRSLQMRRLRLPKPTVKRGERP